jgi:SAM-dependent methyltransferase
MNTDNEWEKWGKKDPYFAVLTDSRYRSNNMSEQNKKAFFEAGENDIRHVVEVITQHIDPAFSPEQALDFGCGTGRLIIPLSKTAKSVTGVDISPSMLLEAKKNCEERGINNVNLVSTADFLASCNTFDFIHSCIVLQHIPVQRGSKLFSAFCSRLSDNGVLAVQLTYDNKRRRGRFGLPLVPSFARPLVILIKGVLRLFGGSADPDMEMNRYNMNTILRMLQDAGFRNFFTEFTDHGGHLGVFIFCKKSGTGK